MTATATRRELTADVELLAQQTLVWGVLGNPEMAAAAGARLITRADTQTAYAAMRDWADVTHRAGYGGQAPDPDAPWPAHAAARFVTHHGNGRHGEAVAVLNEAHARGQIPDLMTHVLAQAVTAGRHTLRRRQATQ